MKISFMDICHRAERNYDKYSEMFGGNISTVEVMELILMCVVASESNGNGKSTYKQFDRFIRDLGGIINEL